MAMLDEQLERWRAAGVLDEDAAARIRVFERAALASRRGEPEGASRPGVLEALLYLGVVVLVVGTFALVAQQWSDLRSWARLAAIGVPAALSLGTGWGLVRTGSPDLHRAGSVVWMVSVGLAASAVAVADAEYDFASGIGLGDDKAGILALSLGTFCLAAGLWALSPRHPQVLAVAAAAGFLAIGAGAYPDDFSTALAGLVLFMLGVAGIAGAEGAWFTPRPSARLFFAILVAAGAFVGGVEAPVWAQLAAILTGAALIALSVKRDSLIYMSVGVIAVFVGLITFIFRHFANEIGAPAALIISGAIVVAGVLLVSQFRRVVRPREVS